MNAEGKLGEHEYLVRSSRRQFEGHVISVRSDDVLMPGGGIATRDVVEHPGAVGVVALTSTDDVVLVRQYRHPMRARLWELPAGLLDIAGESAHLAAMRELREETGLRAERWGVLVDLLTSPGMTDEGIRVFLAQDLQFIPQPQGENEEAELEIAYVPLDLAAARVLAGDIRNGPACAGILAAVLARSGGYAAIRPTTIEWPDRPGR